MYQAGDTPEILDTRDLIEWAEGFDNEPDEDERDTREAIATLEDAGIEDWPYGATMIREDHFTEYAQELAEDIGAINPDAAWPLTCIDWKQAADELAQDYTSVEYLGWSYYVR